MVKVISRRSLSGAVGALLLAGALSACCLPDGGEPPAACVNATTVTLGEPFTVCLPDDATRVAVNLDVVDSAPYVLEVSCSTDVLVKTVNADNFSCASWGSGSDDHKIFPIGTNVVEFGVANPSGNPPGEVTVTIDFGTP